MTESQIREITEQYYFNVFNRLPIALERGAGSRVWGRDGTEYLDFLAGIAVNNLGHCHPRVVEAIREQTARLMHISNIYYSEPQAGLVKRMTGLFGLEKIFLCNSGAEAVEGAIKLARKYGSQQGKKGHILKMENAFHGRTIATISMGMEKHQKGFHPLLPGFEEVPFNDVPALEEAFDDQTVAIILEIIQGSGGLHVASREFVSAMHDLCQKYNALLIVDEVQTGIARTGKWFAYEHYGILPDIVASAKALGNGFPIGAVLAKKEVAETMPPGMHGSTFGGNPMASAAALATLAVIEEENLVKKAEEKGAYLQGKLQQLAKRMELIKDVRGLGLMIGVELSIDCAEIVKEMMNRGVLTNCTKGNIIRIIPPLIITTEEIDLFVDKLEESIKAVANVEA